MIKALTFRPDIGSDSERHVEKVFNADYIKEKGEGRITLLHGSPGLGKTYTIECIAEWLGMTTLLQLEAFPD